MTKTENFPHWAVMALVCLLSALGQWLGGVACVTAGFALGAVVLAFAAWRGWLARLPQQTLMLDGAFAYLFMSAFCIEGVPEALAYRVLCAVVLMFLLADVFAWACCRPADAGAVDAPCKPTPLFRLHLGMVGLVMVSTMVYAFVYGLSWCKWVLVAFAVAMLAVALRLLFSRAVSAGALRETRVGCLMDIVFVLWLVYYELEGGMPLPVWGAALLALPFVADAARRLVGGEKLY